MSRTTKISDFRTLNLSEEKTTPTKKNVGAVSKRKKSAKRKVTVSNAKPKRKVTVSNAKPKTKVKSPVSQGKKEVKKDATKSTNHGIGLAIFFLVLILAGAFIGCLFTPTFDISIITIQNGDRVSKLEISSKLDGIIGENILKINTKKLEENIEKIPYVRTAEVKRVFPNEISVTFNEREPYALIKYLESYVVMDKYLYVLEIKKENDMEDLAIIYGIDADEYIPGEKLQDVAGLKYENVTYLLETSYKNNFDYTIHEINYTDTENLIMDVKELEVDINFGEINKTILTDKMNYLNGILKKLVGKKGNLNISSNNYLEKTIFTERY